MVIMASSIAPGRIRNTAMMTTESQHGGRGHTPNNRLTKACSRLPFTVYFFDIGHPCYDQLTPFKTRYLLTSKIT